MSEGTGQQLTTVPESVVHSCERGSGGSNAREDRRLNLFAIPGAKKEGVEGGTVRSRKRAAGV